MFGTFASSIGKGVSLGAHTFSCAIAICGLLAIEFGVGHPNAAAPLVAVAVLTAVLLTLPEWRKCVSITGKSQQVDRSDCRRPGPQSPYVFLFTSLLIFFFAGASLQVADTGLAPAWDGWEYWMLQAENAAYFNGGEKPDYGLTQKHGNFLPAFLAILLQVLKETKAAAVLYLWPVSYALAACSIAMAVSRLFENQSVAMLVGTTFLATPIINIHASLPGYADIIFAMLLAALIHARILLETEATFFRFAQIIILSLALLTLKQIGLIVVLSMLVAEIAYGLAKKKSIGKVRLACAAVSFVSVLVAVVQLPVDFGDNLSVLISSVTNYFSLGAAPSADTLRSEDVGVFFRQSLTDPSQGILLWGSLLAVAMTPFCVVKENRLADFFIVWTVALLCSIAAYFAFFGYDAALSGRSHNRSFIDISPLLAVTFGLLLASYIHVEPGEKSVQ